MVSRCGNFLHLAEHLRGRGLIKARFLLEPENADGLEHAQGADRIGIRGVFGRFERHRHVALRRQVIDFVRLHLLDDPNQVRGVGQIAIMQFEPHVFLMRILIQMIDAIGIERGGAALDAVNRVALGQQKFGEIRAVLSGDAGD